MDTFASLVIVEGMEFLYLWSGEDGAFVPVGQPIITMTFQDFKRDIALALIIRGRISDHREALLQMEKRDMFTAEVVLP